MSRRVELTPYEKTAIFTRFKKGETLTAIAESFDRWPSDIHLLLRRYGGFAPPAPKRSSRSLTLAKREEISIGLAAGKTHAEIARGLSVARSTVTREVARNGGPLVYRAAAAEKLAWAKAKRPKDCKLVKSIELAEVVGEMLQQDWSPQEIQYRLRMEYPKSPQMNVSHETIYKTLYIQARGGLKKELQKHLRRGKAMRGAKKSNPAGPLKDAISISERPAEVADRAIPGHWEGDLIAGYRNQSFIGTLVERSTRFVKLIKVDSKDAVAFAQALSREVLRIPPELRRTLTWDRGTEMAQHKAFSVATDVKVYFCDPHSPWQRGSNENTNGLLRQYFPKGTNLSGWTQEELDEVAKKLNGRPRQTLGWLKPAEVMSKLVSTPSAATMAN